MKASQSITNCGHPYFDSYDDVLSDRSENKTMKPPYFFNSISLHSFMIAGVLVSSILGSRFVLAQEAQHPKPFFTQLPASPSSQDQAVAAAIKDAGPIADAAGAIGAATREILSILKENHSQDSKYFYTATIKSISNPKTLGDFHQGDRILMAFTEKQINEQILTDPDYRVMGMTEKEALVQSGQGPLSPPYRACDSNHNNGDIANRWCHAAIADSMNQYLLLIGVKPVLAAVLGSLPILLKEYLIDQHPSKSDMPIGEIQIFTLNKANPKAGSVFLTAFADGALYITYRGTFRGL